MYGKYVYVANMDFSSVSMFFYIPMTKEHREFDAMAVAVRWRGAISCFFATKKSHFVFDGKYCDRFPGVFRLFSGMW